MTSTIGTPKQRTAFKKLISDNLLGSVPKIFLNAKSTMGLIPMRMVRVAPLSRLTRHINYIRTAINLLGIGMLFGDSQIFALCCHNRRVQLVVFIHLFVLCLDQMTIQMEPLFADLKRTGLVNI